MTKTKNFLFRIVFGISGFLAYAASKFTSGKLVVLITVLGFLGFVVASIMLAFRSNNLKKFLKTFSISLLIVITGAYLLLFLFVFLFQDVVANKTSAFFQPYTISVEEGKVYEASDILPLDIITTDEIHLRGWLVKNSNETKTPLVIFFNGSGSESSEMIPFMRRLSGWSVALVNYRGFGLSEGKPNHANVLADALIIYDNLVSRSDIDANRVVTMGYSLGTGVAVYLSEQRSSIGTILVSPYDYWTLIGVKQEPLYVPLTWMMKSYFDSISRAADIHTPMLCLIGSEDVNVPPEKSQNLVDAWGGETIVIIYPGEDHQLLFHENNSWSDILIFLKDLEVD